MTATNNDVYQALAKVVSCRDSRRGRKAPWNVVILTASNGTVKIIDLETGCNAVVGKRVYNKKTVPKCAPKKQEIEVEVVGDVRISPVTGKPVRKYTKREQVVQPDGGKNEVGTADSVMQANINNLKELLTQAKVGLLGAETTNNKKLIDMFTKNVEDIKMRLRLLGETV